MNALFFGASMLLVSAATGCYHPDYQAGYTVTTPRPVIQAQVSEPMIDAQVSVPTPQVDVQIAPQVAVAPQISVGYSQPDLIQINPGIQVVADFSEPVFFTDGYYWREFDGGWQRSRSYRDGWSRYNNVPYGVRSIQNRGSYRNYRPAGYTRGYDRGYQPRGGYDRGYDRTARQPYQPRGGYDRGGGYNRPAQTGGYNRPAQTGGYNRPAQSGYNGRQPYQPRTNGYSGRQPYQPRTDGYSGRQGYQPRPASGGSYNRPASGGSYNRPASGGSYNRPASGNRPARSGGAARSYDRRSSRR